MTNFADVYCHTCRRSHPKEEMRLISANGKKKWKCIHSLRRAARVTLAEREAFGRQATENNKAESRAKFHSMMADRSVSSPD